MINGLNTPLGVSHSSVATNQMVLVVELPIPLIATTSISTVA